ncbi:restriction endonuclease subunit S [Paludibacter jiangxiensis]|uniref:Type I restriction enzyme, S subunit n=1 Tax=Paludibacter jiangxiensis TaxID=681398 RepID=A0A161LEY0_9BACT|nr:restriction endonuclease subunit S [Paludibacter jiangxiensis]GAT63395.1 type I restriction enzyme, S subunit [Paludibacter jiangxiensis]
MGLKIFTIDQSDLAISMHCRLDEKYSSFTRVDNWVIFDSQFPQVQISNFLEALEIRKHKKGDLDEEMYLVNISDQSQRTGELENVELVSEIGSDKNDLSESDIFISKLGMPRGYVFLNSYKGKNLIGSTEFIPYKIKNFDSRLLLRYLLLHPKVLKAYSFLESGKTPSHRRVNPYEFLKIKLPAIPTLQQQHIVSLIEPRDNRINELKSQITPPLRIINRVFAREFGFEENLYNEFGKGMTAGTQIAQDKILRVFDTTFDEFARSGIFRFSTRFHNAPTKKLMDFLDNIKTLQVKDVVESFEKGLQPKYNSDGDIPVVKIANLKNGFIDFSDPECVTEEYFKGIDERKKLKQNDIIICCTGKVSLGKIDFFDYEQESITTVDNYIVRLRDSYNMLFFTYFFRSILGYFQVERDYTGATNQIHLYWEEISNFKIPDIPLSIQQKIVDEIKGELDRQEEIKKEIEKERKKIEEIIEELVYS